MESTDLYSVRQRFFLGAYKSLAEQKLPEQSAEDYTQILFYKARAHLALGDTDAIKSLIPTDTENLAFKAVSVFANYISASGGEAALEELRDLCVEIEGDDVEATEREKGWVRIVSGTAFFRAGEIEEALESLGAESTTENLEAVAIAVQIYLSIHRSDLARKEFERAKHWAEDDLLLQLIESTIGLVTGKDGYSDSQSFYTEQLANPSLSSPHLLTARGVTRLLRGEVQGAKSDLEEAVLQQGGHDDAETLAASVVAAGLGPKKGDADELWSQLASAYPEHPLVTTVNTKVSEFDDLVVKFKVPPLAIPAA
ncbi:coatomer epsilon subunit-domain-containing protein [Russula ochroleuca]|jgi:coatomer protein complex subunit epsilon|uniref:Coatomer subunit epsilon n=1 Tax=Russula ochroleuca TaxID=152965 RepID=A0A9P5MVA1_9AGAM|nr:coatomer epsilon subunit-domain-containing protein [Russula ochroleuca]